MWRWARFRFASMSKDDWSTILVGWSILTVAATGGWLVGGVLGIPLGVAAGIAILIAGGML